MHPLGKDHHCCLAVPEILRLIFELMDDNDNARNAQVCKTWSGIALDCLWHSPDSICRVFNALSRISSSEGKRCDFSQIPSVEDWDRFERYSARLKSLIFDSMDHEKATKEVSREVLHLVAQTRPMAHIFPNSNTLIWRPVLRSHVHGGNINLCKDTDACLFMHPGIETFKLGLSDEYDLTPPIARSRFLMDIPRRLPNLTHIAITTKILPGHLDDELCKLIPMLPRLKSVTLPSCHLSARLFEALSKVPGLETLDYEHADATVPIALHLPSLTPLSSINIDSGFHSLLHLETLDGYDDICGLLRHTPKVKTLSIASNHTWETTETLQTLLEVVADQCKNLSILRLISLQGHTSLLSRFVGLCGPGGTSIRPITFQNLQPLMKMPALVELDISDTNTVTMSLSELETILSALPQLKILHFNHSPLHMGNAAFGLEIIPAVGRHCKHLEEFGSFFDATRPIPTLPEDGLEGGTLPALIEFCVSVSNIAYPMLGDVGIYLSRILPMKCEFLVLYPPWLTKTNAQDSRDALKPLYSVADHRMNLWCNVRDMIPPLRRLRLQERDMARKVAEESTRSLERELLELREKLSRIESKESPHK